MSETTWIKVEPEYVPPPEGADVLVTIRRGGKRWVAAAKAMRRAPARALRHHRSPKAPRRWATWGIPAQAEVVCDGTNETKLSWPAEPP